MSAAKALSTTWSRAAVVRALVAAVVTLDLFAFGMVGHALSRSRAQYRERAVVATQNLTEGLARYLDGLFDKVDLALLAVVDEYERALASGGVRDPAAFEAFIVRQRQRVPEVEAIRTADAGGKLLHGRGIDPDARPSIADRPHFIRLRDDPRAGLVVSRAMIGRLSGRPEIVLGRAVRGPDGAFAGIAAAVISLEEVSRSFSAFDVGRGGVIVLRDEDLGLVLRHQPGGPAVAFGSRVVSPELRAFVQQGRTSATYAALPVDGIERTFTFRKLEGHPLYLIAGLAFEDYLGEWRREALVALAIVATFAALTVLAAVWGYRSWRRREGAVEALAEQETRFRLLAESASDLIWMVDRDLAVTYVSPAAERILGYTPEEARAVPREALFTPAELERMAALKAQVRAAPPRSQPFAGRLLEQELVRKDGRVVYAETHVDVLWGADGAVTGALGISRDVTERREMRARVQLAERMASLGTLAAGVAHEINNPLTYVLTNVGFARDQLRATEPAWADRPGCATLRDAAQALGEALVGADRVRHIVRDLRHLSRPEGDEPSALEVNPVVEGCLRMTASLTGARARVVHRLGVVPRVRASEARLAQVVLNLLVNAAQAIPEGRAAENEISVATRLTPDGRVELEVRDSGGGIPPEALPRIFDPFFTTKGVGEGTGLGLSICHGIVTGLGGEIRVETELGRGSRFRVLLPPEPAGAAEAAPPSAEEERGGPGRRVLVVDDDPLVARAVSRMIPGACAVDVLTAPAEALARISAGERWDVILCDLLMPGLSGMDLHERVEAIDAALAARMVFMTGGAFTTRAQEFLGRVPNARLEKPIDRAALERVIEGEAA